MHYQYVQDYQGDGESSDGGVQENQKAGKLEVNDFPVEMNVDMSPFPWTTGQKSSFVFRGFFGIFVVF